ncbi:MAG: hypothetical protein AB7T10_09835 [bacterium]
MEKIVKILKQEDEAIYNRSIWHRMSPEDRLRIVDELRNDHNRMFLKEDEQGFKRVFKKFQRTKS